MRGFYILIACLLFLQAAWGQKIEEGWKGIKVFQSDRTDVERAFGNATDDNGQTTGVVTFETKDVLVHVIFTSNPCDASNLVHGKYKISLGKVLNYEIVPKNNLTMSDLKWKRNSYKRTSDPETLRMYRYENEKDGVFIVSAKLDNETELVRTITYLPTVTQRSDFKCSE